nr:MAG: ORF1 [Torque teno polar bear virus 21]
MPLYRRYRRRRIPRRRTKFRYRRWWRRPWWRRRRRGFRRHQTVRNTRPRYIKILHIKGVEFLGVLGSEVQMTYSKGQDDKQSVWEVNVRNMAPVNKEVSYWQQVFPVGTNDCTDRFRDTALTYWDFVGGFGQAHFSLETLIYRMIFGFAKTNITLEAFQFIKFMGFRFVPQRAPSLSYLFLAETHRQEKDWEKGLLHPINLLNTPGTVIVNSTNRTHCCRSPQIKRKADPTIFGWHDLEDFMKVNLASYAWTYFNPNNPVGRNSQITKTLKSPINNHWMEESRNKPLSSYCPDWADRARYDQEFVDTINKVQDTKDRGKNWWEWIQDITITNPDKNPSVQCAYGKQSPFLPTVAVANTPETFWIRYDFWFQVGGKTPGYIRQPWPIKEADVCYPCKNNTCETCIDPERDLDRYGLLRKKAFQRIISSNDARKRRALEKLAKLVHKRNSKRKKRVSWADEAHQRPGLRFSL